ncbi:DUF1553 domain-containing protein [Catalinimonas niigatensis]|uniref:DUF1553 domain-containing protein n=1 Tax=Catalinimonas niigatensis TaxID=1397264 RepID=UPI002666AF17|nr:DUF1553 domain-containing protein [Catalinimonas niigatensis]WPP51905.1 DUF1553 domain-containing protein [Catalinimonas niigatensis]
MNLFFSRHALLFTFTLFFLALFTQCGPENVDFSEEVEAQLPEKVDFNYHIKPILSDRCFTCHGPDENKREAGLRLDIEENALAALGDEQDHFAIVPGDPHESTLFDRISSKDPEVMMPPPESNLELSEQEVALLTRWIEQGAVYKPHWSFIKPEKPGLPKMQDSDWVKNEIDHFALAKMQEKGLSPSEKASKETLVRRVTFDLTGLPPTLEEIDDFLKDDSPEAYENLVDRLLSSPHYGERMASEWLDVARYADSHGYQDDGMRNMWPWRDWVIESFNENMPYDQFIVWQLAGDLLPDATKEQKLATGFNRNHLQSQEGGIVSEEYRVEYVADRTNTLGKAFLALSTECARCHDHKYDPISQKEYFELFAFFNSNNETGQIPYMGEASPTVILTDEEAEKQLTFLHEKMDAYEEKIAPKQEKYQKEFEQWLTKVKQSPEAYTVSLNNQVGHYPLDNPANNKFTNLADRGKPADMIVNQQDKSPEIVGGKFNKALKLVGDSYVDLGKEIGYFERNQPFSISIWIKVLKDNLEGPVFSKSGGLFNGNRGYDLMLQKDGTLSATLNHTWPANAIEIHTEDKIPVNAWSHLTMVYDGSSKAKGLQVYLNGKLMPAKIITDHLKRSILSYGKDKKTWIEYGNLRIGKRFEETLDGALVDEFQVFNKKLSAIDVATLYGESNALLASLESENHEELLEYYLLNFNQDYRHDLKKLTEIRGDENEILSAQPEVMVMQEMHEPRSTFILDRGSYDAPTEEVQPNTPSAVMDLPEGLPKNRLGLAKWLIHEDNPLTTRVAVNRYWQMIFGNGIVKTSNDFGNQGELPTHPELLDWLAIHFRESGWDVKALLKMMVMSSTYQQSSVATEEKLEKNPNNVWLAQGPSYRMPAEMIRDNVLAASGLLEEKIGGHSVKPYQPAGLWKELATRNATVYVQDSGQNLYRRGLYTIWKRSSPPPSMVSFDASDKYLCVIKRQKTSTPLQSLVLLNDPQYVEASRLLAERMMKEGGKATEKQIAYGFEALTSRTPDQRELQLLTNLYQEELEVFKSDPVSADSLLQVGEYPRDQQLAKSELAALTVVANTLVNYDEAIFKR